MNTTTEPLSLQVFIDDELRKWDLCVSRIELAATKKIDEHVVLVTLDKPLHLSSLRIIEQSLADRVRAISLVRQVRFFWTYQPRFVKPLDTAEALDVRREVTV